MWCYLLYWIDKELFEKKNQMSEYYKDQIPTEILFLYKITQN